MAGKKDNEKLTLAEVADVYGSMNDIQVGDAPVADRRSLNTTRAISEVIEQHYTPDVLKDKDTFLGIVLSSIPSTVARMGSKSQQFETTGKRLYSTSTPTFYVYKVLIPELESRCLNLSKKENKKDKDNPLVLAEAARISTMQDVTLDVTMYDQNAAVRAIQPGTLVKVTYEDLSRFQGPKIVAIYKKIFNFTATKTALALPDIFADHAQGTLESPPESKEDPGKPDHEFIYTGLSGVLLKDAYSTLATLLGLDAGPPIALPNYKLPSRGFGMRLHPIHKTTKLHHGQDLAVAHGTPIIAPADGIVTFIKSGISVSAGWYIEIYHGEWINPHDSNFRWSPDKEELKKHTGAFPTLTEDSYGIYTRYLHTRSKGNTTATEDNADTPKLAPPGTNFVHKKTVNEGPGRDLTNKTLKTSKGGSIYMFAKNPDAEHDLQVKVGQEVTKGQLIGYVGNTGGSTGTHLHYTMALALKLRGETKARRRHLTLSPAHEKFSNYAIPIPPFAKKAPAKKAPTKKDKAPEKDLRDKDIDWGDKSNKEAYIQLLIQGGMSPWRARREARRHPEEWKSSGGPP